MGPEQLLFLLQSRETIEREARYRLMQLQGMTFESAMQEERDRMAAMRKRYTGADTIDQIQFDEVT